MDEVELRKYERNCCNTLSGYAHPPNCVWARMECPSWLGDHWMGHTYYMDRLVGQTIFRKSGLSGTITYLWIGANGWPSLFQVEITNPDGTPGSRDWSIEDCYYYDYNLPHPTAEQMYEVLRAND